jgi:hypothetical protein
MPLEEGIRAATDYQLDELTITGSSGRSVDLREVMRELILYEDLFSNVMTGTLFISDTQDIINLLPIVGGEYLSIGVSKPSSPIKVLKTFRVYKITDRSKASPSSEDYILNFCSEEMILSESTLISHSFKGQSVSGIIEDIANKYLKIDTKKLPVSAITSTTGTFDVVIPFWTPFYAINWLSRMARTALAPGCSFMFFEDTAGYHFSSIELLTQQKPVQVINFMPMNLAGTTREQGQKSDTQMRFESGEDYELVNAPDLLRSISSGTYASRLMRVNILDQQFKHTDLDGIEFFGRTKHTNNNTFMQPRTDRMRVQQNKRHDAYYRVAVDTLKVETWMLQRNAYISALHGFQMKVSLPGNFGLRVGQVITLNLPTASIATQEKKPIDLMFSGNYLITAVHHKFDRNKHICIIELSKDSITAPLPPPLEGKPFIEKLRQS